MDIYIIKYQKKNFEIVVFICQVSTCPRIDKIFVCAPFVLFIEIYKDSIERQRERRRSEINF